MSIAVRTKISQPDTKASMPAPRVLRVSRLAASVATLPSSSDTAPPPIRLNNSPINQPDGVAKLDRSCETPPPLRASSLAVSSPHDAAEKEAGSTASKIMRISARNDSTAYVSTATNTVYRLVKGARDKEPFQIKNRGPALTRSALTVPLLARSPIHATIHRQTERESGQAPGVAVNIEASVSGGEPLPIGVRSFMEPRFGADFSSVRIHTSARAVALSRQLNARAFTVRNHIFFGQGAFQPETAEGLELLAHELTHTIQQGAAVQRAEDPRVTELAPVKVQRFGIGDALDYFADKANLIPGFRMFTIILGVNPINMSSVDRSAANILRALIEFIPGGALITQALDNHGIFEKVGAWVDQQVDALGMTAGAISQAVSDFLDSLSWSDIFDLGGVWERAKRIFTGPIDQIISFAAGLVDGIITFIKEAILRPLAKLAEGTEGYDLLKAVLGQDPVTGDPYPRDAETLIGGFMKLIGQEEVWNNLKKANAVARAWAWFQGAMADLMGFVREIPGLFLAAFTSLELVDIVLVPRAFAKIAAVFGGFVGRFISWAGNTVWSLLEIIFEVVAPAVIPYIKKAAGAFRTILKDPIGFVGNLVRAGKLGFQQFADNIGRHLKAALIGWLTGSLGGAGLYIPQSFELREIVKFVLSILGLTWQNIRQKLVRVVGEPVVKAMETGFDIVVTLVREGPAAAWEKIKEALSNLKEMVTEAIMSFVTTEVVKQAVIKLVSILNPAGAIIQAILAIYNTIMFFIERLKQITQVTMSFVDSIAAIAGGVIGAAANRVEKTLAGLLVLAISFLARFAGLGKVSDEVIKIIKKIRPPIDSALDKVVEWIVNTGKKLFSKLTGRDDSAEGKQRRLDDAMTAAESAMARFSGRKVGALVLKPALAGIRLQYGLKSLEPVVRGRTWAISGEINPIKIKFIPVEVGDIEVGDVPEQERQRLEAKIKQQKEAYKTSLSGGEWMDHLGWCFEQAVSLGMTIFDAPKESVTLLLMELTPTLPKKRLRPGEGESVEGEFVEDVRWRTHYVVVVNGRVFDYEARQQGLDLKTYLSTMFPGQVPTLRVALRTNIKSAADALKEDSK